MRTSAVSPRAASSSTSPTQATLYCFDKRGNLRNVVGAPDTIQGVSVFPPTVAEEIDAPGGYLLANAPVIVHDPVRPMATSPSTRRASTRR